jgi:hypothetical protein
MATHRLLLGSGPLQARHSDVVRPTFGFEANLFRPRDEMLLDAVSTVTFGIVAVIAAIFSAGSE